MARQGFTSIIGSRPGSVQFTVNIADPAVTPKVAAAAVALPTQLRGADGTPYFQQGENINIESLIVKYPYQFTYADGELVLGLQMQNRAGTFTRALTEISDSGRIFIPVIDCPIELNTFIPYDPANNGDWCIRIYYMALDVSMQNIPASMAGKVLDLFVYMKCHSTLTMIA